MDQGFLLFEVDFFIDVVHLGVMIHDKLGMNEVLCIFIHLYQVVGNVNHSKHLFAPTIQCHELC